VETAEGEGENKKFKLISWISPKHFWSFVFRLLLVFKTSF
jgi:hypothetical protein